VSSSSGLFLFDAGLGTSVDSGGCPKTRPAAAAATAVPVPMRLGTTCILAAGCYVVDDGAQPWEKRGTGGYSVLVRVVIRIVRTLRRDSRCVNEVLECVGDAGTSLVWLKPSAARISRPKIRVDRTAGTRSRSRRRAAGESTTRLIARGERGDRRLVAMFLLLRRAVVRSGSGPLTVAGSS
jgi:hypothetical protein